MQWKNSIPEGELSSEEWISLLYDLKEWTGTFSIHFTGGEPFIKKGFFDILSNSNHPSIYSTVCTNGLILKNVDVYNRIVKSGVDRLTISLNSIDPEIHDKYKGVEGTHKTVVDGIHYFKKNNCGININTIFIITKDNYHQLNDFLVWAKRTGIDSVDIQPIRDTLPKDLRDNQPHGASTTNPLWKIDDLEELDQQLDNAKDKKRQGFHITVPDNEFEIFKTYYRDPKQIPKRQKCDIGYRNLIIHPNGDVRLCYYLPKIGNICDNSLKELWFLKDTEKQRKSMINCQVPCVSACLREFSLREKIRYFFIRLMT